MSATQGQVHEASAEDAFWGLSEVATYLGVTYNSARTYHGRAEINRRHGQEPVADCKGCAEGIHHVRPDDLPVPDRKFGKSPVWFPRTIQRWNELRPGRGHRGSQGQG